MVSRRRMDERGHARRMAHRQPRRRILVVCEGKLTEPAYLQAFQHDVRNPLVHVEVAGEHPDPQIAVETAIRMREQAAESARRQGDDNLRWDEVWAAVDGEEHPPRRRAEAVRLATEHSIKLAISNPCFELWALLHFQDQRAHIERDKVCDALRSHMEGYKKLLDYPRMRGGYEDARRRAEILDEEGRRYGQPGRNPTTGVYLLTESIRRDGRC